MSAYSQLFDSFGRLVGTKWKDPQKSILSFLLLIMEGISWMGICEVAIFILAMKEKMIETCIKCTNNNGGGV